MTDDPDGTLRHDIAANASGALCHYCIVPSNPDNDPYAVPPIAFIVRGAPDAGAFTLQDYLTAEQADTLAHALANAAAIQRHLDHGEGPDG